MGRVDFDFSDVDSFFEQGGNEVKEVEEKVGKEAVEYAVQHGSYQNHTGTLRKSNKYSVSDEGLELKNDAKSPEGYNYASNVESKGYEVLSGAALFAEKRLKEEIE
ncbi:hypothetical protein [uncultured Phocaeicola sp.]|uniref:hypothetical protein n=1 Tax=uncultured Phocaeicola sp. TaxID=990718 RepID=UPI0025CF4155|nr:hypothetical protein [uncultured Phocaeicola sp.]